MSGGITLDVALASSGAAGIRTGFQHSGSRLGAAFAPTLVVFLIAQSSWRTVFYVFGWLG